MSSDQTGDKTMPDGFRVGSKERWRLSRGFTSTAELNGYEFAVAGECEYGLEGQLHHLSETVDDLRKRLDQSEGRVTALLGDQRPRSIWKRIFE